MPVPPEIKIYERFDSREIAMSADSPTVDLVYMLEGSEDEGAVEGVFKGTLPGQIGDLYLESYHLVHLGGGVWEGTARYAPPVSETTFSFETGGGSQHIVQSIANIARYPAAGGTAPDFRGAIGVTNDSVEGVDIQVPIYTFSESHIILNELVTQAYKLTLFQLTGKVNTAGFKGFARGEVLFLGASGSKRGFDDWEITFRFAASPNATNLNIGGIGGINKEGWQYLWIRYEDEEDVSAKTLIKRPSAIYIEQVYNYGDFALMGIGV
jgi:hypothetical protein